MYLTAVGYVWLFFPLVFECVYVPKTPHQQPRIPENLRESGKFGGLPLVLGNDGKSKKCQSPTGWVNIFFGFCRGFDR